MNEPAAGAGESVDGEGTAVPAHLRDHLIATRIAGPVGTPREVNLRSYRRLADGIVYSQFGLSFGREWTPEEILEVMVRRCGVHSDPRRDEGQDWIEPDRTIAELVAAGDVLEATAAARGRVVVATGHPGAMLAIHLEVAAALRRAGCTILQPGRGWRYEERKREELRPRQIRYLGDVAMVSGKGELNHTHSARPMQAALAELAEAGEPMPDLVFADHGWAGAAAEAGCTVVGFADSNDPALFLGQEVGKVAVVVPLDDNVSPQHYAPLTRYLVARISQRQKIFPNAE
ncbi:MAG: phosphatase [Sporichthyaceae bacterium]